MVFGEKGTTQSRPEKRSNILNLFVELMEMKHFTHETFFCIFALDDVPNLIEKERNTR